MTVTCKDEQRRHAVRATNTDGGAHLNGLDYLEVSDDQRTLTLYFLGRAPEITAANVRIDGGRRITGIRAVDVRVVYQEDPELDDYAVVRVDRPGDFSTYTLRLVEPDAHGHPSDRPLAGFDQRYNALTFSFKVNCPAELDCKQEQSCPPDLPATPEFSYLAKDYASFRRLILDRLALTMPAWTERHIPDVGIALVELLAYAADHLSYYQDAVATEAYLDTARRRVSVRRHVRLVDYRLHEGTNARTWAFIETDAPVELDPADFFFVTRLDEASVPSGRPLHAEALRDLPPAAYEVFAPLGYAAPVALYPQHNRIELYTWGDRECCLPAGATSATLRDAWALADPADPSDAPDTPDMPPERERMLRLKAGDLLLFEEVIGPRTGNPADADPTHRHVVRLTSVEPVVDALDDTPLLEVSWAPEDALPFPLCISATTDPPACAYNDAVSVARGNLLLVDHGRFVEEDLPEVPAAPLEHPPCHSPCQSGDPERRAARYRPRLRWPDLTHRAPYPAPAQIARSQAARLRGVVPAVRARLEELLAQTRAGRQLGEGEMAELRTLFGNRALVRAEVAPLPRRPMPDAATQARGLARLVAQADHLLGPKFRRVAALLERAVAGYVLDADAAADVGTLLGERYAAGLSPHEQAGYGPASLALEQDPREALPVLTLTERRPGADGGTEPVDVPPWTPAADLLAFDGTARRFVAEVEDDRRATLRFGDGAVGRAPTPGVTFRAAYRVGDGPSGNIGAEALAHIVFRDALPEGVRLLVRNPLPARGGRPPQPVSEARLLAPSSFRAELARAVTAEDYARIAERHPAVQRAAAVLRWSGSWYTVHVAVDPLGGADADQALLDEVAQLLEPYRRIGHDLQVTPATPVPLEIELLVCVRPGYLRGHVRAALLDALGARALADGRRGFFHPDNLTFGAPVALSRLVAAATAVAGVESVQVKTFKRLFEPPAGEIEAGLIPVGPLEIARLDNDPNRPEHGTLRLTMRGGR